ncbi:MAG: hypothetical protein ACREKE_04540 [bacterium]
MLDKMRVANQATLKKLAPETPVVVDWRHKVSVTNIDIPKEKSLS